MSGLAFVCLVLVNPGTRFNQAINAPVAVAVLDEEAYLAPVWCPQCLILIPKHLQLNCVVIFHLYLQQGFRVGRHFVLRYLPCLELVVRSLGTRMKQDKNYVSRKL